MELRKELSQLQAVFFKTPSSSTRAFTLCLMILNMILFLNNQLNEAIEYKKKKKKKHS